MKTFLLLAILAQAEIWTADEHKAGMNDASDLTEDYWSAKKQADIVKLAQASRALARQLAADGKGGKFAAAATTFARMNASCNTCHDLHPEKR